MGEPTEYDRARDEALACVRTVLDVAARNGLHGAITMRHPDGTDYVIIPASAYSAGLRLASRAVLIPVPPTTVMVHFPGDSAFKTFEFHRGGRVSWRILDVDRRLWISLPSRPAPASLADLLALAARICESAVAGASGRD